jgi:repressor LexA
MGKLEEKMADSADLHKKSLGERLEKFIDSLDLSVTDFAKKLGLSYDKVLGYKLGRSDPNTEFLKLLKARFPQVDLTWIITGEKEIGIASDEVTSNVPILHDINAGIATLGFGDQEILGYLAVSGFKDRDLFALRIKGASMEPEISDGDFAICSPYREFINGKIYAVVVGDSEATLKQVWKKEGGFELVARNPEFRTQFVETEKMIKLYRVIEVVKKYL